jgi:hypothetical protein
VNAGRYRLLGLAHARSVWFRDLSRWSTNAALPIEFVKCMAIEELGARLASGHAFSAVIVDGGLHGVDRDLIDAARQAGAAVIVIEDARPRVDWRSLGVDAVLPDPFDRASLLAALVACASPIEGPTGDHPSHAAPPPPGWRGRLVAVTGPGGAGTSTLAGALAQGLGSASRHPGLVALADLALDADQGLLHDAGDVMPGLQELVEAHRRERLPVERVRSLTFDTAGRGYDLLLGLRRHRDWPVLRPRAVDAALDALARTYRLVVADVDPDLEGDDEVGSIDIEERNVLARTACARADLVLVVAPPTVGGLRRLVLILDDWHRGGLDADRLVPVINRAPRRAMARAELTQAVSELMAGVAPELGDSLAAPLFVAERRGLDHAQRAAMAAPVSLSRTLADAVEALLDRVAPRASVPGASVGERVAPGSLGAWADEEAIG